MAIVRANPPTRRFVASAYEWLRDPELSGKAKGYLAYIASHAANYDLTFEQIVSEMKEGPSAVRAGLDELEDRGYLRRPRRRNPDGTLGGYDWHVIDHPGVSAGRDQVAEIESGSDQEERDVSAGQHHTRKPQPGSDLGKHKVFAGEDQTRKPQPGVEQPERGVSAGRNQTRFSHPKKNKELQEENQETHPSPYPLADPPAPSSAAPREEGEGSDFDQDNPKTQLVAKVHAVRPRWSRKKIAAAIDEALDDGRPFDLIAEVFPTLAADPGTQFPGRLPQDGPWWEPEDPDVCPRCAGTCLIDARDQWDNLYKATCADCADPEHPPERCPKHPLYPAKTCLSCRADWHVTYGRQPRSSQRKESTGDRKWRENNQLADDIDRELGYTTRPNGTKILTDSRTPARIAGYLEEF